MKEMPPIKFSEKYLPALRNHVQNGSVDSLQGSLTVGDLAVALEMETLDLAKVHEQALESLISPAMSPATRDDIKARAKVFFTEAIIPIEKTHLQAQNKQADLHLLNEALSQRTQDLVNSQREVKDNVTQRKAAEEALKASNKDASELLNESTQLQKHLQELAHQILSANEDERQQLALKLQDEIAQTLLAIQVRLLTLDKELSLSTEEFKNKITSTQQLVNESVAVINRYALELGIAYEN